MKVKFLALLSLCCLLIPIHSIADEPAKGDRDYTDRMAVEHARDTPEASAAARQEPEVEVATKRVQYATIEGDAIEGYMAWPANDPAAPGLLVIHEWWGLNENIETMARRLAGQGYRALAVDLYEGEVAKDPEGARALMSASMERKSHLLDNLKQAHAFLREHGAKRVGSIGWCFGGAWTLQSAIHLGEDLDAAVIYYGRLTDDSTELAQISAPVLGHFGSEDRGIPLDSVDAFEKAMQKTGKSLDLHVYEGANHAFANPSGQRYDAEAAEAAWARTVEFLVQHLKP